jgi:uncharacterized protein (TIGR02284 family)
MAQNNEDVIGYLNDLIETCNDGEKGFRAAAARVGADGESELRTVLNLYAQQRAEFAAELQNEVLRRGGEPTKSGHVSAAFRRGWLDVKSALKVGPDYAGRDNNESEILTTCDAGERAAMGNYEDVLKKMLPADLLSIVENQYREIRQAHERLRLLSTAFKPAA